MKLKKEKREETTVNNVCSTTGIGIGRILPTLIDYTLLDKNLEIDIKTLSDFNVKDYFTPLVEFGEYIRNENLLQNILLLIDKTFYDGYDGAYYKNDIFKMTEFFKKICIQFGSKNINLKFLGEKELYINEFELNIKINNNRLVFKITYDYDCDAFNFYSENKDKEFDKLVEEVIWYFNTFMDYYEEK